MDLYLKGKQRREDDDDKICITCMCNMHAVQQSIKKKGPRMSTATTTQSNRTTLCVCVINARPDHYFSAGSVRGGFVSIGSKDQPVSTRFLPDTIMSVC